eukprot:2030728-Pleurochrysis_carterae.AAC.1
MINNHIQRTRHTMIQILLCITNNWSFEQHQAIECRTSSAVPRAPRSLHRRAHQQPQCSTVALSERDLQL